VPVASPGRHLLSGGAYNFFLSHTSQVFVDTILERFITSPATVACHCELSLAVPSLLQHLTMTPALARRQIISVCNEMQVELVLWTSSWMTICAQYMQFGETRQAQRAESRLARAALNSTYAGIRPAAQWCRFCAH
jgi:hypothetical protein